MARRPLWLRFLIPARPGSGRTLCVATRPSLGSLPGGRLLLTAAQDEGLCHRPPQEWQAGPLPLRGAWSGELCPQPRPQASPVPSRSNAEMDPATLTPRCGLPRVRACCPAKPHAGSCPCQEEARLGAVGPWPRFPDSCCLCPLGLRAGRPCRGKLRFRAGTSSHTTPRPSKYSQHSWAQLHSESLMRSSEPPLVFGAGHSQRGDPPPRSLHLPFPGLEAEGHVCVGVGAASRQRGLREGHVCVRVGSA